MALSTCTVTGSWPTNGGVAATGQVTIQPVQSVTGGAYIIAALPVTAPVVNGQISVTLFNNNEATALQYRVTEQIRHADNPAPYIVTPTGSTLDLSSAPRSANAPTPLFVLSSTVGQANGVASLDGTGKVPAIQLPATSTGVTSVTAADATIVVAGTSTAPTVGVGAIPESKVTNLTADLAAKYVKPGPGIPSTDLSAGVQTSLGLADTALQAAPVTSVAGKTGAVTLAESDVTNLVTDLAAKAPTSRQIIAGTGLTGGGTLAADRTLTVSYGTSSGTAAQGNDSRITGALQASSNLSDVGSASTARTNLGLGTAAVLPSTTWPSASGGSASSAPTTAFQHRRDTAANWTASNPTLAAGELGFETDTGYTKLGDGSASWTSLGYTNYRRSVFTAASISLIACTGDASLMGGSPGISSGRPYIHKVFVDQPVAANKMTVDLLTTQASTVVTNAYMGVYSAGGTLLAQTADISSSFPASSTGAIINASLTSTMSAQPVNTQLYLVFLLSWTGASPTVVGGRQFGTNQTATFADARLFSNSGTILSSLPGTLPSLVQTSGFTQLFIGLGP